MIHPCSETLGCRGDPVFYQIFSCPFHLGCLPESGILIFLRIIVALLTRWFLFFRVICFTQFIPFACLVFLSRSQPVLLRDDSHLVPLKPVSALPAIISILLYGASCFAFILHPESNDLKTLNWLIYTTLLSCPISQKDLKKFYSNFT